MQSLLHSTTGDPGKARLIQYQYFFYESLCACCSRCSSTRVPVSQSLSDTIFFQQHNVCHIHPSPLSSTYRVSQKTFLYPKKILKSCLSSCVSSKYEILSWICGTILWDKGTLFGTLNISMIPSGSAIISFKFFLLSYLLLRFFDQVMERL